MTRRRRWAWLGASVVVALAGCATMQPLDDTRIEAEVKAQLVAERQANLTRLGVVSTRGVVYLSGTVASDEEKAQAETLTRGVRGVRRVVNTLRITPESR